MFYDFIPGFLHDIVKAISQGESLDPTYLTISAISAASSAIGVSESVAVHASWTTHPALFTILVGRPGTGKTPPLNIMYKPLFQEDAERYKNWVQQHKQWKALDKEQRNDEPEPVFCQTVLSDCTPESALTEHWKNQRGITIFNDEILGFFKSMNRYASGNFMEQLLSAWSGTPIKITRKGEDFPMIISNPCISMIGTIQPGRAGELLTTEAIDNGLVDRLLLCFPRTTLTHMWGKADKKDEERTRASVEAQKRWGEIIHALYHKPYPKANPRQLTPEAREKLYEIRDTEVRQAAKTYTEDSDTRFAKRPLHIARLALVLQCMAEAACATPKSDVVTLEAIQYAAHLEKCFTDSLKRLQDNLVLSNGVISNNPLDILKHLPDVFTFEEFDALVPEPNVRRKGRRWRQKLAYANMIAKIDTAKFQKINKPIK